MSLFDKPRSFGIFAMLNNDCRYMDYSKKQLHKVSRCLECGDRISYGRSDKKFCCEDCKNRHHNQQAKSSRNVKRRIMSVLERNYAFLDTLVKEGVDAIWLSDALAMGFNPGYATSCRKHGCHNLYGCYDITYIMTPNRLSSISKIQNLSLNLQARPENSGDV